MNVTYFFPEGTYSIEAAKEKQWIDVQAAQDGSYLYLPLNDQATSQYSGYHHLQDNDDGWAVIKTLHSLGIPREEITEILKGHTHTEIRCGSKTICYRLVKSGVHVWSEDMPCTVVLDCRHIYDYNAQGRIYTLHEHDEKITVEYNKYQTDSLQNCEYSLQTHIIGTDSYKVLGAWKRVHNKYDERRNSQPTDSWVYAAAQITPPFNILISNDEYERVPEKCMPLNKEQEQKISAYDAAKLSAIHSLDELTIQRQGKQGIFAGLPWFFHWWTRDEAISAQGLLVQKKYDDVVRILGKYNEALTEDGRLPNRFPPANLGTADGTGWQMVAFAKVIKEKPNSVPLKDALAFFSTVKVYLEKNAERHMSNNLTYSSNDETWMDTNFSTDQRKGYCIEIQALVLAAWKIYKQANAFNKEVFPMTAQLEEPYKKMGMAALQFFDAQHGLADRIVERGGTLACDFTQRPNIFLAYYVYPEMFVQLQWEKAFDKALEQLWCSETGLASIQKDHHLFCPSYTPTNNQSYHRGDVWFWVNNMAAIALLRCNYEKYKETITQLIDISCKECLSQGAFGHCAEVSSANRLESMGCPMQAWSAAILIEALNEYNTKNSN